MGATKRRASGRKRIVDLEVDENSLVDKPAIGETFFVIKSLKGGAAMMVTKELIEKASGWSAKINKAVDHTGEACLFCKEAGGREPKIGLLCSVCFTCAFERTDKGVFDECVGGTFDLAAYQKKYPDEFKAKASVETDADKTLAPEDTMTPTELRQSLEQRSKRFGIEILQNAALTFPAGFPRNLADYGDPVNLKFPIESEARAKNASVRFKQFAATYGEEKSKAAIHERITRSKLEHDVTIDFDPEDPLDRLLPPELKDELTELSVAGSDGPDERIDKLEKQLGDVTDMLQQSLDLHDSAAAALNQIVMLTTMALEQIMMLSQDDSGEGEEATMEAAAAFDELLEQVASVKSELTTASEDVTKIGAKISGERMRLLRDISTKLTDLIRSLTGGKKAGKASNTVKSMDSLRGEIKAFESQLKALRTEASAKADALAKRLGDLENTAGASGAIGDDDEGEDADTKDTKKSLFSDLIGLDDIKVGIQRREAFLKRSQGGDG